jgi:hypothetical protein
VIAFLGILYSFLTTLGHLNISKASVLARWMVSPLLNLFSFWLALTLYTALTLSCNTIIGHHTVICDLATPLVHCWEHPLPRWVPWFAFLTFLFLTCPPLYPHMSGCSQCLSSIIYTAKVHMNGALNPLVSPYFIFHVFCCLPPCVPADQFLAHYSI